jgi:uncharacterized protein (DUF1800 family)
MRKNLLLLGVGAMLALPLPSLAGTTPLTYQQKCIHLLDRLTYGPKPGDLARIYHLGPKAFIEEQLNPDSIDDSQCEKELENYPTLKMSSYELFQAYPPPQFVFKKVKLDGIDPDKLKAINEKPKKILEELSAAKLTRILDSKRQLQEVMTDFWFNHFNVSFQKNQVKWMLTSYERDAIRPNVFGKFRDLVGAVAHSPAMMEYLDNATSTVDPRYVPEDEMAVYPQMMSMMENRAGKPKQNVGLNENYARELMELHTLGVDGGYSQQDVIQVARALTGWSFQGPYFLLNPNHKYVDPDTIFQFQFHPRMHDLGEKVILGQKFGPEVADKMAEDEGDQVLDLLCRQSATAHFIATKLCRHFVSDNPPEDLVQKVADKYMETGGDIREMLRTLFTSPEFYNPRYYRAKVKTPLEYLASALRATDAKLDDPVKLSQVLGGMGEPLYQCEPPTGYPDDAKSWISSGELLNRMNFGLGLLSNHSPATVDLAEVIPAINFTDSTDGKKILNGFFKAFLQGQVSASTRRVLVKRLADPEITHAVLDDRNKDIQVVKLGALVLGSPDFQRR